MKKEFKVTTKREDGVEETKNYYVVSPTQDSVRLANKHKIKAWNECLVEGIFTKKQLEKVLVDRGIWDENKEKEQQRISETLSKLEKQLFLGSGNKKAKLDDGKKLALEMRQLRAELRDHIAEKISMEENTAEAIAENARFDFLVSECVFNEDGTRVYKDIDDYNQRSADNVAFLGAANLAQLLYQYDSKFEEGLPENLWLKQFGLINDKMELVDESGQLVDEDGRKINSLGHYINENGQRVDRDGNLLNEDGSYVLQVEYEKDSKKRNK